MRLPFITLILACLLKNTFAHGNYQGLLWKITGKDQAAPSYLYGTMHVSNKLAFHLGEPFFNAIRQSNQVALEVSPETWLHEYFESEKFKLQFSTNFYISDYANTDPFERNYELFRNQKDQIKQALSDDPAIINSFMFRSDKARSDFQENTYLDLYIYQVAKKSGKPVIGLENVKDLDYIQDLIDRAKAYEDNSVSSGKNRQGMWEAGKKLEEAYRRGDLDELDSLSAILSTDSTREYLLFKRNLTMVERMVKAMQNGSLFTGMGAAHLPGPRGVIELLRQQGYTVTPVDMGTRDAATRERIDSIVIPKPYSLYTSPDSMFSVEVPEKMYCIRERAAQQDFISGDMTNGIYFTIARIKTYAGLRNVDKDYMKRMTDSLLYENIPGKILEQKDISNNGYQGFYILNRTRKGDLQSYHIYFTDDEIYIFKVSGTGDNAQSTYANKFLSSIRLNGVHKSSEWQSYQFTNGGFSVRFPGKPINYLQHPEVYNGSRVDICKTDNATGNTYFLFRLTLSNIDFIEEDTFDLSLMAHQYGVKNNYKTIRKQWGTIDGRKALYVTYNLPDTTRFASAAFTLQNLHYYVLAVYHKDSTSNFDTYFQSLKHRLPTYSSFQTYTDSILHYTVSMPYIPPVPKHVKQFGNGSLNLNKAKSASKSIIFSPPGSFESVEVNYYQYSPYYHDADTAEFLSRRRKRLSYNNDFSVKSERVWVKDQTLYADYILGDTNSTRLIMERVILKNGLRYTITSHIDTTLGKSDFVKMFYESFNPIDTNIGFTLFKDASQRYINDLFSADSLTRKRALDETDDAIFLNTSASTLLQSLPKIPAYSNYADIKENLLGKFAGITKPEILPYLEKTYMNSIDTPRFQFAILKSLAKIRTPEAATLYRKLITAEPPLSGDMQDIYNIFNPLYDSLSLYKQLFPALFDLTSIEEYKYEIFSLMAHMLDSNHIKPSVYKSLKNSILNEAKLELKRLQGSEDGNEEIDGLYRLLSTTTLLRPYSKEKDVFDFYQRLLKSGNLYVRMAAAIELNRNSIKVADSIWLTVAEKDNYRISLYTELKNADLLNLFPGVYKSQVKFNDAYIRSQIHSPTNTLDSLQLLLNVVSNYRGIDGRVYLYRYKVAKDKDWKLALVGLQPVNENQVNDRYRISILKGEYEDSKKTAEEQMYELMLKVRKKKARNAA